MKKILISAYNLEIGGIETSLINFLKNIDLNEFDVTLLLQDKRGLFLPEVPKKIKVREYKISNFKITIVRKIINRLKMCGYIFSNYKKYDHAIHYATYDIPSSILCLYAGKKTTFWIHSDYTKIYNEKKMMNFFNKRKYYQYDQLIVVSNEIKENFLKRLEYKGQTKVINNLLDIDKIKKQSHERLEFTTPKNKTIFVFVGRLEEASKRVTRLLEAFKIHVQNNETSLLWIIGNGPDRKKYEEYLNNNNLKNNVTIFGQQSNPYKYINNADCLILTSDYEGFPVVLLEGLVLNKKIISTISVSANNFELKDYINLVDKKIHSISQAMDKLSEQQPPKLNYKKVNDENRKLLNQLLMEG